MRLFGLSKTKDLLRIAVEFRSLRGSTINFAGCVVVLFIFTMYFFLFA